MFWLRRSALRSSSGSILTRRCQWVRLESLPVILILTLTLSWTIATHYVSMWSRHWYRAICPFVSSRIVVHTLKFYQFQLGRTKYRQRLYIDSSVLLSITIYYCRAMILTIVSPVIPAGGLNILHIQGSLARCVAQYSIFSHVSNSLKKGFFIIYI